jgi:hypothetical protein
MKNYDFNKAKRLIEERKESIQSASLGMHEDWFWTAETVFENGVFKKELFTGNLAAENNKYCEDAKTRQERNESIWDVMDRYEHILISGINGSDWATPALQLIYNDDTDEIIPCFVQEGEDEMSFGEKVEKKIMWTSGCLSGPVQENITPLSNI